MSNTPNIRFKGFTDLWEQRKLEDIMSCVTDYVAAGSFADIRKNVTYLSEPDYAQLVRTVDLKKKFSNNDFVFIDKNAFEYLWRVNLSEECIVLPNIGANIGEVYHVKPSDLPCSNNVLGPNAILLRTNEDTYFVFTALGTDTFQNQLFENVGSSGQPKFNKTELKNITLTVPSKEEQIRIGACFSDLDNLITLHQRKCDEMSEFKKFMLQKMFPKNGQQFPETRFGGFTDPWEQRKLGDVTQRVQGNDGRMDLPTLTISAGNGWLDQRDRFSSNIAGKEQKNYTLLHKGELSYNHGNSKLAKYGTVFSLRTYEEALVPRVYHSFKVTDEADADFIEYVFATKLPDKELGKLISSGARMDGLLNINYDEFMSINISMPSIEEQKCLSDNFRKLDTLITLHQRKCDVLKDLKKFMLQNMFPKKG